MKLTLDNYKGILDNVSDERLLGALLTDLYEYNTNGNFPHELEIHYITEHTTWSPERVDPCPDYYGTFVIRWEGYPETINDYLSLKELDDHMCTLCQAFEQLKELS